MLPVTLCSGKVIEGLKDPKMKPSQTSGCEHDHSTPCSDKTIKPYTPSH